MRSLFWVFGWRCFRYGMCLSQAGLACRVEGGMCVYGWEGWLRW